MAGQLAAFLASVAKEVFENTSFAKRLSLSCDASVGPSPATQRP